MTEDATTEFRLGRGSGTWGVRYFNGTILDGVLYDKELNQAEITQISNSIPLDLGYGIFNGTTSIVNVPDNDLFSFVDGNGDLPFSVSAWVKQDDALINPVITKRNVTGGFGGKGLEWEVGFSTFYRPLVVLYDEINDAWISRMYNTGNLYAGIWVHLICTYSGSGSSSGLKVYINGSQVDDTDNNAGSYTAMSNGTNDVKIGEADTSTRLNGQIRNVKIFSEELSQASITQEYTTGDYETNLVANYNLHGDVQDSGPNRLHGIPTDVTFGDSVVANYPLELDTDDSGPDGLDGTNTDITLPVPLWETYTNPITRLWHWVQARMVK